LTRCNWPRSAGPQLTSTERIRFVLDQLMDRNRTTEMTASSREWDRAVDGSPNRLDAAVWGITRLSKVITQIPIA
jgi:hypothetical protein